MVAGAAGWVTGNVLGARWAWSFGVIAGINGLVSGANGIYRLRAVGGWLALLADSTWAILGTALGNLVHAINLFWPASNYRRDLCLRMNRHLYEGGMCLKPAFAFTLGNVISNAALGRGGVNEKFIEHHEQLHVWQGRMFGPLFAATYLVWGAAGALFASAYWIFNKQHSWRRLVETLAYYDNPFEYWAYNNDDNWPPSGVDPALAWRSRSSS